MRSAVFTGERAITFVEFPDPTPDARFSADRKMNMGKLFTETWTSTRLRSRTRGSTCRRRTTAYS
jgi:hypothetical protein